MHAHPMAWAMPWWSIQRISSPGSRGLRKKMTLLSNTLPALLYPLVQEAPLSGGKYGSFRFLVNLNEGGGGSPSRCL